MACVQQVRTSQGTQMLPNQVTSEQQSLIVVKKLLAIAVSGITYLRGLFPEKAFGAKHVDDQKVMILREEKSCPGANLIVKWMQGCFDAIQKKYLRTVILSIYTDPDDPQKVTELYYFRIQYTINGANMDLDVKNKNKELSVSCGHTKKASVMLVRKLYTLMQNLGPLPDSVSLNMKLAFYDDVTPLDYQPPGFKEAKTNSLEFEQEPVKLNLGEVKTGFHTLKMDMATERQRLEQVEESQNMQKRKWVLTIAENDILPQKHKAEDTEESDVASQDQTDITLSCHEIQRAKITERSKMNQNKLCKNKMELEIIDSQDTASPAPRKKSKLSEPNENFQLPHVRTFSTE